MKIAHKKIKVHLQVMEDSRAKDVDEEEVKDEGGVKSFVIIVAQKDTLRETVITPLVRLVSIVENSIM